MALFITKSPQYRSKERVPARIGGRYADLRPSRAENQAIVRLGNLLVTRADEMKKERDAAVVGDLYNRWRDEDREALTELLAKKGKDAVNLDLEYDSFYKKSQGDADNAAENGSQQGMINEMLAERRERSLDVLAKYESQEGQRYKQDQAEGVFNNKVSDAREAAGDELKTDQAIIENKAFQALANPGMSPEKKEALDRAQEGAIRFAGVQAQIENDPEGALVNLEKHREILGDGYFKLKNSLKSKITANRLNVAYTSLIGKHGANYEAAISEINNPESEILKNLDYNERSSLNSRFVGLYNQRESVESNNEADRAQAVADKDFETWIKYSAGTLPMTPVEDDPEDLETLARNRLISKETYMGIKNITKKGAEFNNPWVLGEIVRKISRGEDVRSDLAKALQNAEITNQTFISLSGDSEDKAAQEGLGLLARSMEPSASDKWAPDKNVRYGEAVDLFNITRRAEPERLPIDIAREILFSYQEELRRTRRGLPRPTYFKGKDYNYDSLLEAQNETARAYSTGKITKEAYDFQMKTISSYFDILSSLEDIDENLKHEAEKRNAK